jgi:hypothetical protein
LRDIKLSSVRIASAKNTIPQISTLNAAETSIHGPDRRLRDEERDRALEEPDRDREEVERDREEPDRLDRERLLVLRLPEVRRLLLERLLDEGRLIVLRLAIAQMFSLVSLLYHRWDVVSRQLLSKTCTLGRFVI